MAKGAPKSQGSPRGPREPQRAKGDPEGQGSPRATKGSPEGQESPRTVICNWVGQFSRHEICPKEPREPLRAKGAPKSQGSPRGQKELPRAKRAPKGQGSWLRGGSPLISFCTTMGLKAFLSATFGPNILNFFDLCLHWVSVVSETVPS